MKDRNDVAKAAERLRWFMGTADYQRLPTLRQAEIAGSTVALEWVLGTGDGGKLDPLLRGVEPFFNYKSN